MKAKNGRAIVILVTSTKGGAGKSTTSKCILTSAAYAKVSALGVDLDEQETLYGWSKDRELTRKSIPQLPAPEVIRLKLKNWRKFVAALEEQKLVVIDTPIMQSHFSEEFRDLAAIADLVIVPTRTSHDELKSNIPYLEHLKLGSRTFAFLNQVNRRSSQLDKAKSRLLVSANVAPVVMPVTVEFEKNAESGLLPLDITGAVGRSEMNDFWNWLQQEVQQ